MRALVFCFNDPAATDLYTLSLHDALPISLVGLASTPAPAGGAGGGAAHGGAARHGGHRADRKSTRLNSSHLGISYAVFCLKKKKTTRLVTCHTPDRPSDAGRHQPPARARS